MKEPKLYFTGTTLLFLLLVFVNACNNAPEKTVEAPVAKDTIAPAPRVETKRAPIININDTVSIKRIVLTIKDSAATLERVGVKLGEIYGVKLPAAIESNNLKITGKPMAWYKTEKAPYFFEAGIPVDKRPKKAIAGVQVRETGVDSIVVAHFYGPYDLLPQGYEVLRELLKERKKKVKGAPYEIYVDDAADSTGRPKDPYKVLTDIVFPWRN